MELTFFKRQHLFSTPNFDRTVFLLSNFDGKTFLHLENLLNYADLKLKQKDLCYYFKFSEYYRFNIIGWKAKNESNELIEITLIVFKH